MTDGLTSADLETTNSSREDVNSPLNTDSAYFELLEKAQRAYQEKLAKYPEFVKGDAVGRLEYLVKDDLVNGIDPISNISWYGSSENLVRLISNHVGLYEFTTESIRGYLPLLEVQGKRCLTVAASGDHIINLLMAGAREVVAFDIVPEAQDVLQLKMQALIDLNWKDANHFRTHLWRQVLRPEIFARLLDRVPVGKRFDSESIFAKAMSVFPIGRADSIFKRWQTSGRNAYIADEQSFNAARDACRVAFEDGRVTFINADVRELPYLNLGSFDAIVLSNILQSRVDRQGQPNSITRHQVPWKVGTPVERQNTLNGLVNTMVWPVAEMLTPGGQMMASYCYACDQPDEIGGFDPYADDESLDAQERAYLAEERNERLIGNGNLSQTVSRRLAFKTRQGYSVTEHQWEVVNGESSGVDIAVMIQRDVE
jgi:hypothetical protein